MLPPWQYHPLASKCGAILEILPPYPPSLHTDKPTYKYHKGKHYVGESGHTFSLDVIIMESTYCDIVLGH